MLDLTSYMDEAFLLPRRQLVSAIDARVGEMLEMTTAELKHIGKEGMLPAGVVLSGGGSKLAGFAVLVRDSLGLPVRMAKPVGISAFDAAMDPSFATALGLIVWAHTHDASVSHGVGSLVSPDVRGAFRKAVAWLKNFLP
jgi:cell division protein FtsA